MRLALQSRSALLRYLPRLCDLYKSDNRPDKARRKRRNGVLDLYLRPISGLVIGGFRHIPKSRLLIVSRIIAQSN